MRPSLFHHNLFPAALFIFLAACLADPSHGAMLEHKPYLQNATPTSMVVRWRTDTETNTKLVYGASPDKLLTAVENPAKTVEHEVEITGLTPGSKYYYTVGSSTEILAGGDADHFFFTPPNPGATQAVRIWAVGDSGTANAKARAVRDAYLADRGDAPTDVFLMLGDNAYNDGTNAQYTRAVFEMYPMLMRQTPTWPTLGNHDGRSAISSTQSGPYYDLFTLPANGEAGGLASGTEAYYSFDYANIHFVCLNSHDVSRETTGPMLTWLQSDLSNTTQTWIIAYWHHPPYSKGTHDSDREGQLIEMRENALPILEAHGVDLVLTGHSHVYERSYLLHGHYGTSNSLNNTMIIDIGDGRVSGDGAYARTNNKGTVYIVSGTSGKTGSGSLDHPAMLISMSRLGSLAIDINGNLLEARFIDSRGVVKDNFTITKGTSQQPQILSGDTIATNAAGSTGHERSLVVEGLRIRHE